MDGKDFDALVERLTSGTSRRNAVRGMVGGALTSVGAASLAEEAAGKGKGKGKRKGRNRRDKGRDDAAAEKKKKKKKTICFCPSSNPLSCTTLQLKKKNANKMLRKFPNSTAGECLAVTTAAPTTAVPTTSTSTSTTTPTTTSTTTSTTTFLTSI